MSLSAWWLVVVGVCGGVVIILELAGLIKTRMLLRVWIALTIGWLGFASFFVWRLWPQYDRFFQTPDNPLYGAILRKHLTESLGFALVPPAVAFVIGWLVLWAVRGR